MSFMSLPFDSESSSTRTRRELLHSVGISTVALAGLGSWGETVTATHNTYTETDANLIVDPDGDGDYTTLHAAEDEASEGDVIFMRNAHYQFDTRVEATTPNLTIVGESTDVVLDSRDDSQAIIFRADGQELWNVTIINTDGSDGIATFDTDDEETATFRLEEVRFTNHWENAVKEYGVNSNITIYANRCYWYDGDEPLISSEETDDPDINVWDSSDTVIVENWYTDDEMTTLMNTDGNTWAAHAGDVEVYVMASDDAPIEGASVSLVDDDSVVHTAKTNESGFAEFEAVPQGVYEVVGDGDEYTAAVDTVELEEQETKRVTLVLEPASDTECLNDHAEAVTETTNTKTDTEVCLPDDATNSKNHLR